MQKVQNIKIQKLLIRFWTQKMRKDVSFQIQKLTSLDSDTDIMDQSLGP